MPQYASTGISMDPRESVSVRVRVIASRAIVQSLWVTAVCGDASRLLAASWAAPVPRVQRGACDIRAGESDLGQRWLARELVEALLRRQSPHVGHPLGGEVVARRSIDD